MIKSVNDKDYQALLRYLKAARDEQGLTVRDVGKLIGESNQIVSKIETGIRKLSVHEYVQYCEAMGLNPLNGIKLLCKYDWADSN
ncbi:MAG: XRE family transcriptional regulator [Gammaproteobacteria bacterium]|nr:MAG: XRE family transcriptional regulator [Gammaproteobacteria bacterium]